MIRELRSHLDRVLDEPFLRPFDFFAGEVELPEQVQDTLLACAKTMLSGVDSFKEADRHMPVRISKPGGESCCSIGENAGGICHW